MKIIIDGVVYSSAPSGGVYRYFNEIIPRLSKFQGAEINIFTGKNAVSIPSDSNIKISSDKLPTGSWLPDGAFKSFLRLGKRTIQSYLLKKKFDGIKDSVFHSTYYTPPPWQNIKQVVTIYDLISELVHETYHLPHHQKFREAKSICLKTADRVIAISEITKRDLQKVYGVPEEKIDIIHLGVDHSFFSNRIEEGEKDQILSSRGINCPYFFYLGGRLHHKNFPRLLTAFAQSPTSKDLKLVVAGTPWEPQELAQIESLGIKSKIIWVPTLKEHELPTVYQNAQALLFPSYYEGFGLPLIEAMAAGCPVAASNTGPFPELSQGAALLFDPFNEDEISKALESVLVPKTRSHLIEAGKVQAQKFSWETSAQKHFETYQKALTS